MEFSESFKKGLFDLSDRNFNEKALELFRYQAENNLTYRKFIHSLGLNPASVDSIESIPFLPIEFFKTQPIVTGQFQPQLEFHSSGTTGQQRSRHFIKDPSFCKEVARRIFESQYGPLQDYILFALLPSYQENKNSSLIFMIDHFMELASEGSSFVSADFLQWKDKLEQARRSGKKILLWAVSYALLDLSEKYSQDFSDLILMETGGMKGRREELTREELHGLLKAGFNVQAIHSEYGMTELVSQAYSKGDGLFFCPPWMKILIRDRNDPFSIEKSGKSGVVNIIDLANVDSCAFIGTQDVGQSLEKDNFKILGRMDNSDTRGCNLLYLQ